MNNYGGSGALGVLDTPAGRDEVGVEGYVKGLAEFVRRCETPMTVAVQGDWGTGKTSVMTMLANGLSGDTAVHVVNFNTWQYSQFDLGDQLATSLLLRIISGMPNDEKTEPRKVRLFKIAQGLAFATAQISAPVAAHAANMILPGAGDALRELAGKVAQREQELEVSPVEAIERLRSEFAQLVADSGKRVLVFVDDLDRLEPKKAVELMEAIKLFLDVPNCVFVIAIDFDVVKRGVMEKYGDSFSDRKARAFFEKIIQVPFQLPTHAYETATILEEGLKRCGLEVRGDQTYAALARASIGTNPRATKRLINTFALLKQVPRFGGDSSDADLFASLCLQSSYPEIADYLNVLSGNGDEVGEVLPSGVEGEGEENVAPVNERAVSGREQEEWADEWKRATAFLMLLREFFSGSAEQGEGAKFDEERFKAATRLASVTSAGDARAQSADSEAGKWKLTTDADEMRARLSDVASPEAIEWGEQFRDQLRGRLEVVGQKGASWTIRRTDRTTRRRIGELKFGKLKTSVVFEQYLGAEDPEAAVAKIEGRFPRQDGEDYPRVQRLAGDGSKLGLQWRNEDPIDTEEAILLLLALLK